MNPNLVLDPSTAQENVTKDLRFQMNNENGSSPTSWHLGTMGFGYKQWVGAFFPAGMASRNFLAHYSQLFDTVEIDSTFYGTPKSETVQRWRSVTPSNFTFCLKTPRAITHDTPIADSVDSMLAFVDVARLLGQKMGPILIQFGPEFDYTQADQLHRFLESLPIDVRYAVEFRHRSWARKENGRSATTTQHLLGCG